MLDGLADADLIVSLPDVATDSKVHTRTTRAVTTTATRQLQRQVIWTARQTSFVKEIMHVVKQTASSSIREKKSNGHSFFLIGEASLNKFKYCRDIPWLLAALVCYGGPGGEQWDLSEQCHLSAGWRRYLA